MYLNRLHKNFHLTTSVLSLIILFLIVTFWGGKNSKLISVLQDIISLILLFSLTVLIKSYIKKNKISFLSLTYAIASLFGVLLIAIFFSSLGFNNLNVKLKSEISLFSFASNVIGVVYLMIFCFGTTFAFVVLKEFHFSKRTRFNPLYFQLLIIFGILTSITYTLFSDINESISTAFLVVSIVLIIKNSLGISWIAFLTKKEKYKLLFVSLLITILASLLIGYSSHSMHAQTLATYSMGFYKLSVLVLIYAVIYFGVLLFTVLFHLPTAEAFDRKAEEVSSLHLFSSLINQVLDFDELVETITELTRKVSGADSSWFVLYNDSSAKTISYKNISNQDLVEINNYLLNSGECKNLNKAKICSIEKSIIKARLSEQFSSILIAPLRFQTEIKGFIIAARKSGLIFFEDEVKAINAFSDYASIALENSRLLKESIEKERLEKELDVAREMQKKLLPAVNPDLKEIQICSVFIPAFEVGGDFYDFYADKADEFSFVIGDVAGKGISAAFVMAEVKGIFESLTKILSSPKEILFKANQILARTLHRKNFVSALYGNINLTNSEFKFARAGHCPAILVRGKEIYSYQPKGLALGLDFTDCFSENLEEVKINLKKDDTLIFYTDGVTEAKNKSNEDFGESRFLETIKINSHGDVNQLAKEIISEISIFTNDSTQYDDITLLILRWN